LSIKFAKRMDNIRASEIRELLKITQKPGYISFGGGFPAPELFPVEEMINITSKVLLKNGTKALQYGPTEGYPPLREAICRRMEKIHVNMAPDNILITSGSQQGLDFAGKIFINPGDKIIVEKPSYLGAINAFKAYEPTFIDIEMDDDGMIIEDLEIALSKNDDIRFIYVIPDFQNPTGKTWSIERRKRLIELANKYDVVIIEDNPYGELRFEGEILPAIKHFDTENRVIFLGTFSKILCPGLRVGWVAASDELLHKFILVKQGADLQSSTIAQMEIATFLNEYDIDEHIEKIKYVYRARRNLMIDTMRKEFPEGATFTYPNGGLFTWVTLPEFINTRELAVKALEQMVAFVPGGSFYANGGNERSFRCNYSCMDEENIVIGVKRLANVINEEMMVKSLI
jgi:DNA-binding transcriptional MocR family regulator